MNFRTDDSDVNRAFARFRSKRLHDSILSIISVSSTFASLNLNR